jgi:hypothetical protein
MTNLQNDRFGINIIRYCKEHENYLQNQLNLQSDLKELLNYHNQKIKWLQHERLVHFLVTMLTAILVLFLFAMTFLLEENILIITLLILSMLLLTAYLFHYFRLENTVQHWYKISDLIYFKLNEKSEVINKNED